MVEYPRAIQSINSWIYLIEILFFFWAVRVFLSEQKQLKIETE